MTKPMSLQEFAALTESFANFWMKGVAVLPANANVT